MAPDNWQETQMCNGKMGWINTKDVVIYRSIILGYGFGPIERRGIGKSVANFIQDHCGAAVRFRSIAIAAYESIANTAGRQSWTSVESPTYLALSAGISAIDALACVLWGVLFSEAPSGAKIPNLPRLVERLKKGGHPLANKIQLLQKKSGFVQMRAARNQMVHRGYSAFAKDAEGFALKLDRGMFQPKPPGFSVTTADKAHPKAHLKIVNLGNLMLAVLGGLEKWEAHIQNT